MPAAWWSLIVTFFVGDAHWIHSGGKAGPKGESTTPAQMSSTGNLVSDKDQQGVFSVKGGVFKRCKAIWGRVIIVPTDTPGGIQQIFGDPEGGLLRC